MGSCYIFCNDEVFNLYGRMCFSLQVSHLGLDAAREAAKKQVNEITFEPANAEPDGPKEGAHDDKQHSGGNTFAGGVSAARDPYIAIRPNDDGAKRQAGVIRLVWADEADTNDCSRVAISSRLVLNEVPKFVATDYPNLFRCQMR